MARRLHTSSPEETSQGEDLNELLPGSPSQAVAHHFSTEIKAVSNPDAAPQVALSMADKLVIIPPLALLRRSRRSIAPSSPVRDSVNLGRARRIGRSECTQGWTVFQTPCTPDGIRNTVHARGRAERRRRLARRLAGAPPSSGRLSLPSLTSQLAQ